MEPRLKRFLIACITSITILGAAEIMERYYGINWFFAMPVATLVVILIRDSVYPLEDEDL